MRIIQIIDSLDAGGAERMAVGYANALANEIKFSALVATRKEGNLRNQINDNVSYLFLNKKRAIDFSALLKLRNYVRKNKIEIVHAHSTSFFTAFLLKLICPTIKLIWHDHYGDSDFLSKRRTLILRLLIPFFSGIIVVNQKLMMWSEQKLKASNVILLANFPSHSKEVVSETILNGIENKRILLLANLRTQKNHFFLLEVAKKLKISHPEWTFHLVGKDFYDSYSQQIKELISTFELEKSVFLYGSKQDVQNILRQTTIGILTSKSEGLPVSLLEYAQHKLPVVTTNVGEIVQLVKNGENGFIVEAQETQLFIDSLVKLIEDDYLRSNFGQALFDKVSKTNSGKAVIKQYLNWIQNSCK
jgi:glycosyltransferase involved in cell wall biosynthesis